MVPEGWKETQLGEVVREFRGGGTPSRKEPAYWGGAIPWASVKDLNGDRISATVESITEKGLKNSSASIIPAGTVILATRMAIGKAVTAQMPVAINQDLKGVIPTDGLDSGYLRVWLNWRENHVTALSSGTTVKGIRLSSLRTLALALPPLPEQKKIAAILCSVDDAIAATRKLIEQTKRVKKGLLQTLMTRGIGHTRFKKTEIGEIPEEWEVVRVENVSERGSGHTPSKSHPEYWGGDIQWVSLADSPALDRVYLAETDKTITPKGIENSSAVLHPPGTVFVSRDASVGRSAIAACELAVSQHFIAWQCGQRLDNHFLYYFLQFHKPQFERFAVGSTVKTIGLRYFKRLQIPLPPLAEQKSIAEALVSHDEYVWVSEDATSELERLKRGLLQDLLTGRVRVPHD